MDDKSSACPMTVPHHRSDIFVDVTRHIVCYCSYKYFFAWRYDVFVYIATAFQIPQCTRYSSHFPRLPFLRPKRLWAAMWWNFVWTCIRGTRIQSNSVLFFERDVAFALSFMKNTAIKSSWFRERSHELLSRLCELTVKKHSQACLSHPPKMLKRMH